MQNYVGQQIDRYRIIERLGVGGMAVVYKAYDTRLERDVALKLIRVDEIPASQHERLMKRFEREAKAMAKFSHPNIVPVYDYGEVDGSPYLVMEYIPGGTLKDETGQPVPLKTALSWIIPIADALAYAHEFGVVHRDIKPSNILFDMKGRPILTDFGVAKVLETDEATLTGTGMGVGTPEYMAPEQWQGRASEATDQYALGVVLYELLTGCKPYKADTPAALVILQATEPLPKPSDLVLEIPEEMEKVLYKALARDPQDRYESMITFQKALQTIQRKEDNPPPVESFSHEVKHPSSESIASTENETFDVLEKPITLPKIKVDRDINRPEISSFTSNDADLGIGSCRVNAADGAEMVYIPAGSFTMGSELLQGYWDEKPVHKVYLDAYWMYRYPVTNKQFAAFLNAVGNQEKNITKWYQWQAKAALLKKTKNDLWSVESGYEDHPAVQVSWYGAQAYCNWAGGRLPTEAEWEKAARGEDGRKYPWGNEKPTCSLVNFYKHKTRTTVVGSYPNGASPYGILDMVGNVWEWVADWYNSSYYLHSPTENPTGPTSGAYRVLRGGSWYLFKCLLRASNRDWDDPDRSSDNSGFRCVLSEAP